MTRTLLMVLFVVQAASVSGCGILVTLQARTPNHDAPNAQQAPVEQHGSYSQIVAEKFTTMAIFAEASYRRSRQNHIGNENECLLKDSIEFIPPYFSDNSLRWTRLPILVGDVLTCASSKGLYFETHVLKDATSGEYREAVIAFRGTETRHNQWFRDISASFAAMFGFEPMQYQIARQLLPGLIEHLRQNNPNVKIYAVGHSLGGGLAQQAGYLSRDIVEVITFNTSPVTNWTYLRHQELVDNEFPIIYRVYHGGEILENLRFYTTAFTATRFGRYDIGLQYGKRSSIKGHSMTRMMCALADILVRDKNETNTFQHGLQVAYLKKEIFKKGGLCES